MKTVPLGEVADFVMGQAPPGDTCNHTRVGTPFVKAGEFGERWPLIREWTTQPLQLARSSDVLVCVVGATSGKVNLGADCAIGRSVAAVRPIPQRLDQSFAYHFLRTQTSRLRSGSQGSAQGVITRGMLAQLEVPDLALPEQRRIANVLDKADAIRRKRKETIALTHELQRSAFLEMFGDPVTNPKRWEVKPFGSLVRETQLGLVKSASEQSPDRPFSYIRMNAIRDDGRLDLRDLARVDATDAEREAARLRPSDFLFNTRNSRELVGKAAVFHGEGEYLFNNNILRVRFVEGVEPDFVCAYWQTAGAQRELDKRKAGTTSVFAIYYKSLATLPVPVPPLVAQRRYAHLCESVRTTVRNCEAAHEASNELFESLLSRSFNGTLETLQSGKSPERGLGGRGM